MSGFFFKRTSAPSINESDEARTLAAVPMDSLRAQAITASAIFAMLVSKGVLTAREASEYMKEIGTVLERDVGGGTGRAAGDMLQSYGEALLAAGK